MSTFPEVFRFEIHYRLRQPVTWLYAVAVGGITWILAFETMIEEAESSGGLVYANSPGMIAISTVMVTMLMLAVTAGLFGDAASRDLESGMYPLVFTAPVTKHGYLAGRFAAAFVMNALLLALVPIGLMLTETQRSTQQDLFGPFRLAAYVQPYFVFALPTVFATGAVIFAVAALTGRTFAGYAAGAFLFFGGIVSEEVVADQMNQAVLATLLDPFGFTAMSELAEYWTPFEKNTLLISPSGGLLLNRLAWLALAAAVLALTQVRFRLSDGERRRRKRETRIAREAVLPATSGRRFTPAVDAAREFGLRTSLFQMAGVAKRSFSDVLASRSSLVMVSVALLLILLGNWDSAAVILETPTWPMTYLVAREIFGAAGILVLFLITIFAGELVWRDRDAGVSEMTDAAPVATWVRLAGKFCALVAGLVVLMAAFVAVGVLLQALHGYHDFELGLYARLLFGIQLTDFVLWAALAMLIHVLVNQKYVAHFVFVLYCAFYAMGRRFFEIEHNLLVYPSAPRWSYSDISGFEPFLGPWLAFKAFWAAWALLFLVAASLFWVRGRETRPRQRLRAAGSRLNRPVAVWTVGGALAVAITGGWVFYNTNILNEYTTRDDRQDLRAEYERLYKRYEKLPQPLIKRSELNIEIEPVQRAADIRGSYLLENATAQPIESVHVLLNDDVEVRALAFDRTARRVMKDDRRPYQIFALEQPLQPGDTMRLNFRIAFEPRGFSNNGAQADVLGNGTYFNRNVMPIIGYQPEFELTDNNARKTRGLPPRNRLPAMDDQEALRVPGQIRDARWLDLEVVIGTAPDQIALAPGSLRRTWLANGRRYFHYATDAPIQNSYAIHSAAYAVRRDRWKDVDIEVYHHPRHITNIDRIVASMKATLEYHTDNFGPYPHRQLRIVEFPRHAGTYARAYPNTIAFSEGFGFMAKVEDGIDYPFLVAAHEVSHQWWGNQLRPARVEGGPVLAETFAHYGALMVGEKAYGPEPIARFRRMLMHKYLVGRQNRRHEVPLLISNDQKYIHYDKGAVVMYALRDYIGEERVNTALRRLYEKHRFGGPPYPTTREFYAELQAVTPDQLQYLLKDLVEEITLWDLRAREARVETDGNGGHRVTFTVEAQKLKADASGRDKHVPMDDLVEIGVFAEAKDGAEPGDPLYLQKHRIRSGAQTITVTVPRAPARVAVDPYRKLIEREFIGGGANNIAEITTPAARPAPPGGAPVVVAR